MSRKSVGYQRGYEHTDFSDLLDELNGNISSISINGTCAVAAESVESNILIPKETETRHRIMSDEKFNFCIRKNWV